MSKPTDQTEQPPTSATAPPVEENIPVDLSKLTEKEAAYALLRQSGMMHAEACKALDIKTDSGYNLSHRIKKKTGQPVRSLGLADSKYVKAAHRAVNKLVRGKPVGDMKTVTGPVVMSAVNTILDRAEPVIRKQINVNLKADCSPVNLDKYLMDGKDLPTLDVLDNGPEIVTIEGNQGVTDGNDGR